MGESQNEPEEIAEYYTSETVAEKYTESATDGLTEKEQFAIDQYFTRDGAAVLDLGCGTGRTTAVLDERGFDVIGVDLLEPQVDAARAIFPDVEFAVGDATSLPFADGRFDYVMFSFNGIDDLQPEEKRYEALLEIWRVLADGGIFLFSSHNLWTWLAFDPSRPRSALVLLQFWRANFTLRGLSTRYKLDHTITNGPELIYYSRPGAQRRQLEACGFELLETVLPDPSFRRRFDPWHYYVARKLS